MKRIILAIVLTILSGPALAWAGDVLVSVGGGPLSRTGIARDSVTGRTSTQDVDGAAIAGRIEWYAERRPWLGVAIEGWGSPLAEQGLASSLGARSPDSCSVAIANPVGAAIICHHWVPNVIRVDEWGGGLHLMARWPAKRKAWWEPYAGLGLQLRHAAVTLAANDKSLVPPVDLAAYRGSQTWLAPAVTSGIRLYFFRDLYLQLEGRYTAGLNRTIQIDQGYRVDLRESPLSVMFSVGYRF